MKKHYMTKKDFDQSFIDIFYGTKNNLLEALHDYPAVHLQYMTYMDGMCKDHQISQKQYQNWTFPWKRK